MSKLRPHHINCIFFYKGLGYSKEFVENMNYIINELSNEKSEIMLINDLDDLCCKCPNNIGEKGTSNDKVIELDSKTIRRYNLRLNEIYDFKDLIKNIYLNYNEEDFKFICSNCQWHKNGTCSQDIIELQRTKWLKILEK